MLKELANYSQISLKSKSPSLAVAMQKAKGSMFPFGWYHMLKALKKNDTLDLLLIAIDEEYRNKGVNAMIIDKFAQGITKNGIKYIESMRELEDGCTTNLWHTCQFFSLKTFYLSKFKPVVQHPTSKLEFISLK